MIHKITLSRVAAYILILIRQRGQVNMDLGTMQCEEWPSQGSCVLDYTNHIITFNFRNLYRQIGELLSENTEDYWKTYGTYKCIAVSTGCQRLFTSNQTEVVSLPVNKYWPTNIVAPGVTACKDQRVFFFSAVLSWGNKRLKVDLLQYLAIDWYASSRSWLRRTRSNN